MKSLKPRLKKLEDLIQLTNETLTSKIIYQRNLDGQLNFWTFNLRRPIDLPTKDGNSQKIGKVARKS